MQESKIEELQSQVAKLHAIKAATLEHDRVIAEIAEKKKELAALEKEIAEAKNDLDEKIRKGTKELDVAMNELVEKSTALSGCSKAFYWMTKKSWFKSR